MLLLFQGYFPQDVEPTPPEPEIVTVPHGGYRIPEVRKKLLYIYKIEDIEKLTEEEMLALWSFTEIL